MLDHFAPTDTSPDHRIVTLGRAPGLTSRGVATGTPRRGVVLERCPGQTIDLNAGATVVTAGDAGDSIWLVRTGLLRIIRQGHDGRRQIMSLSMPGEVAGHDDRLRPGARIETATPCSLCRIDRSTFDALLASNPTLQTDLQAKQRAQLDRLLWLTWSIAALQPDERFSGFLALSCRSMPYQPLPDGTGILTMLLPRQDIADLLATSVASINTLSQCLHDLGIIEIRDPTHFRILNMKVLIAFGRIGGLLDRRGPDNPREKVSFSA